MMTPFFLETQACKKTFWKREKNKRIGIYLLFYPNNPSLRKAVTNPLFDFNLVMSLFFLMSL